MTKNLRSSRFCHSVWKYVYTYKLHFFFSGCTILSQHEKAYIKGDNFSSPPPRILCQIYQLISSLGLYVSSIQHQKTRDIKSQVGKCHGVPPKSSLGGVATCPYPLPHATLLAPSPFLTRPGTALTVSSWVFTRYPTALPSNRAAEYI